MVTIGVLCCHYALKSKKPLEYFHSYMPVFILRVFILKVCRVVNSACNDDKKANHSLNFVGKYFVTIYYYIIIKT